MQGFSVWPLLALFSLLLVRGLAQNFDLSDALDGDTVTVPPKPKPKQPIGGGGAEQDLSILDALPTKKPADPVKTTSKPKPKPKPNHKPDTELDLSDALDPKNDIKGGGGSFTDDDLFDVGKDESYKPDKGKGGISGPSNSDMNSADDGNHDTMAETGTIAGIVSAVAMALVGAISSYISYQKKKFCFSIQQSLNADMVKAENPEAVVAQEPQVQQTLLQPPNAEPPAEDNVV